MTYVPRDSAQAGNLPANEDLGLQEAQVFIDVEAPLPMDALVRSDTADRDTLMRIERLASQSIQREKTRSTIAVSILGLTASVIIGSGLAVTLTAFIPDSNSEPILEWARSSLVLLSNFGCLTLGFYFGTHRK